MRAIQFGTTLAVIVVLAAASTSHALDLAWGGSGLSGVDPLGNAWQILNTGPGGASVWGIPGNGLGTTGFQGPADGFVRDFHISFLDLPADVSIVPTATGTDANLTTFADTGDPGFTVWNRAIHSASSVSFAAPAGTQLDVGESFFTNVVLSRALSTLEISGLSFRARWTDDGVIPEPATATLGLLAMGALGTLTARRRRAV
jgi:hypothetical protein